jgi:phage shock protein PspC (stress-responsive transcriptional regulator)
VEQNRLTRSRDNAIVGGVCAGLGAYLNIDPTWVRLFFVLLTLAEGAGVWIYIILWLIVPREDWGAEPSMEGRVNRSAAEIAERAQSLAVSARQGASGMSEKAVVVIGGVLILYGAYALLDNLNLVWVRHVKGMVLPVLLLASGALLLVKSLRES